MTISGRGRTMKIQRMTTLKRGRHYVLTLFDERGYFILSAVAYSLVEAAPHIANFIERGVITEFARRARPGAK